MKGFVKACLIAVLVFVVAGIVLLVVAAAGGVTRASLRLFSDQGRLNYGPVHVRLGDGFSVNFGNDDEVIIVDASDGTTVYYEKNENIPSSNGNFEVSSMDIKELQIDANAGDFYIEESMDGKFYVQGDSRYVEVMTEGDCLMIDRKEAHGIGIDFMRSSQVQVFVPAGYQFDEITMKVGAGYLDLDTALFSKKATLEVGAGAMALDENITADYVKMDVGAGEIAGDGCITAREHMELQVGVGCIELDQINCEGTLDANCNVGSLIAEGSIGGDVKAQVDVGEMELDLRGNGQKYNYRLDVGVGEIEVNQYSYSGLDSRILLEGDEGAPEADLSCGVGSLEIDIR